LTILFDPGCIVRRAGEQVDHGAERHNPCVH
jgi:hypothetical protein